MSEPEKIGNVVPLDAKRALEAVRAERIPAWAQDEGRTNARPPHVPARYAARLEQLDPSDAVTRATAWLQRVRDNRKDDRGLLLLGKVGRGKSAIAGALAVEAGAPVYTQFWPVIDLLNECKAEMDQRSDRSPVLYRIAQRRLLVLDDVGSERTSDWTVGVLTQVIAAAYDDRRLLVVTSNLTPDQLAAHLGQRTVSRLNEMTELVVVDGPDRRLA